MNVCMVGYGMMGHSHSEALRDANGTLHTLVGRRAEPAQEFATQYGYRHWTTDFAAALADDEIDVVILANPSEQHAETALASLQAGKHTLVEIPLAMNLADAERVVAEARTRKLNLGVVHPLRMRPEMIALRERALAGDDHVRQVNGRFYIRRLANVGGSGYQRSWTDNLLWHHMAHICDFGLWMLGADAQEDWAWRSVAAAMTPLDPTTGSQMDVCVLLETERDQTMTCTGSYYSRESMYEAFVVTDDNAYRWDIQHRAFVTGGNAQEIAGLGGENGALARDFVDAAETGRPPAVSGESVLPAMRLLQHIQDGWDARHGTRAIPGRPT